MLTGMPCVERARLLRLYSDATEKLSEEVQALATAASSHHDLAFDRAWEKCEELRFVCSQIQEQIYQHLREHRCALEINPRVPRN
jgi:hypothetical protein